MPEIIAITFDGQLFARPDDDTSPWTLRLQTLPSDFWIDLAVTSGGVFALSEGGAVAEIDGGLTTHTVLPSIGGWGYYAMTASGSHLVAITYSGELFSTLDPSVGWDAEMTLAAPNFGWTALAPGPAGTTFAGTDGGEVHQISADFSSSQVLRSLPLMWGLTALATNEDASQLVAITYEGRLYSRPTDDPAAQWVEHLKIPRIRDF